MKRSLLLLLGCGFLHAATLTPSSWADLPNQSAVADSIQMKVEKFKLKNGLTVLLHEDHSSPIITYQQWFRVGSRDEKPGRTGLAHFFEHLMFKGTAKHPAGSFDKLIRSNGGTFNAYTTRDYTAYYINLPPDKLQLAVDLESDRMRNLNFIQSEIDSEREVVKEERRMRVDNEVAGVLDEKLWRTVFKVHPYGWPVIGSMVDLNGATMQDMKEFYRVNYAPNNAIILLVGAFDTSQARKMITQAYEKIPAQEMPKKAFPSEPEQKGERRAVIKKQVQNITAAIAFPTVASGTDDMYALDLASSLLGGGDSSRLYRRLVYHQQSVSSISAYSYTPADPGLFRVSMSLKPGQEPENVFRTVMAEIYKLRTQLVSDQELEKAKNWVMKDYVESLMTISGKARSLGVHEIYGNDYQGMFRDLQRYIGVTKEQIKTAAEKYLKPNARTVVWVQSGQSEAAAGDN